MARNSGGGGDIINYKSIRVISAVGSVARIAIRDSAAKTSAATQEEGCVEKIVVARYPNSAERTLHLMSYR